MVSAELCEQLRRNTKDHLSLQHRSGFDDGARFECTDGERWMAVGNARDWKCVPASQGSRTVCDDYFRVADKASRIFESAGRVLRSV